MAEDDLFAESPRDYTFTRNSLAQPMYVDVLRHTFRVVVREATRNVTLLKSGSQYRSSSFEGTRIPDAALASVSPDMLTLGQVEGGDPGGVKETVVFVRMEGDDLKQHALTLEQLKRIRQEPDFRRMVVGVDSKMYDILNPTYGEQQPDRVPQEQDPKEPSTAEAGKSSRKRKAPAKAESLTDRLEKIVKEARAAGFTISWAAPGSSDAELMKAALPFWSKV